MKYDLPSFAGGEIGPDLVARSDTAKYRTALRRARNVILATAGGAFNRPGMLFAGEVHDHEQRTRVIPFQFSVNQGYALELGQNTLRVVTEGGYVLRKELLVAGISNAVQAVVDLPAHGYEVGWDVVFQGIEGMTEINGLKARIVARTDDDFTISLDTTGFGVFTGSGGGVAGDANGGTGGDPPAPAPPAPTDPPPATPPFEDVIEPPPVYNPFQFRNGWIIP